MPIFRSGDQAPAWSELEFFEIVRLEPGQEHTFARIGAKEKIIVGSGTCGIWKNGQDAALAEGGANLDLTTDTGTFRITDVAAATTLIRMCGRWEEELGGSGLFGCVVSDEPKDGGDRVQYPKQTNFDSHFHDCDEYWILFEGRGEVFSEGCRYAVGPGDCVATGMGHHHDMPIVDETIHAVYFETTMEGQKRRGHLWDHKHGAAQPQQDRV